MKNVPVALLSLSLLLLTGCSKLNSDNFDQLEAGMSKEDVIAVLGEPDKCESALAFESCRWGDDDQHIDVRFAADNLLAKTAKGL